MRTWRKLTNGYHHSLYYDGVTIYYDRLVNAGTDWVLLYNEEVVARLSKGSSQIDGEES